MVCSRALAFAVLLAAAPPRVGAAAQGAPSSPPALELHAAMAPRTLPADQAADVSITLRLTNVGHVPVDIFPQAVRWSEQAGWAGPFIAAEARLGRSEGAFDIPEMDPARRAYRELRTTYGQPGRPPSASFFEAARVHLMPGQSARIARRACFVPRGKLLPEHVSRHTLDPDQMDGYGGFTSTSVLALDRTCAELDRERGVRPDFLRPGVSVFLPTPGMWQLRFSYWQHQSVGLSVRAAPVRATAPPLLLDVP